MPSETRIDTLDSLREHLQWAVELEHATLPPYLCALYSLDPERNPEATAVVSSVFAEEMLHLTLAANLLNAVGGRPRLDMPRMLPPHPRPFPHDDRSMELSLLPSEDRLPRGGPGPSGRRKHIMNNHGSAVRSPVRPRRRLGAGRRRRP
ncbi:ferritin-like domain-containing protein [Streptosporangium canum]|uniref:ferritin-like domain-containing protein n=1 Tax=Streptosporangium canum TaxID=324952 RepID=UPI0037A35331